jgi:hypothetical protein
MADSLEALKLYLGNMEEIKARLAVIDKITGGNLTLNREDFDYELACIHLRKSLELISYSSIVANKDEYARIHEKYASHWRAKDILNKIEKLNPDFYPRPVYLKGVSETGVKQLDYVADGFLTKDEFEALYDRCSDVLHVWNPYDPRPRQVHFGYPVAQWVEHIRKLLSFHVVSLIDGSGWAITLTDTNGKAHGYSYRPATPEEEK